MRTAGGSSPVLSVIVTTRNDDPDGRLLRRTQFFVAGLAEQSKRHNLDCELVIVEWNPPSGRKRLADAIEWPKDPGSSFDVRIIEVPPRIHDRFDYADRIPLFQMIAKNAGIRRARGRFILATNVDVIFSEEMVGFFASGRLAPGHMYRVDRYDVRADVPEGVPIQQQLAYCGKNVIRINRRYRTRSLRNDPVRQPQERASVLVRMRIKQLLRGEDRLLHTNACGDFTLMAREHWLELRGYPEFPVRAFKLDGLLCYAAHYAGARETVLRGPLRVYHVEHPPRSDGALLALSERGRGAPPAPQIGREQYEAWTTQMRLERRPFIFNKDDGWGLADEGLPETTVARGHMA